ncbi:MAG: hypothetical protein JWO31_2633 [Phycisphaerales bacterium]|nr:hypothetical protein [Phycisphaerales bacterium]
MDQNETGERLVRWFLELGPLAQAMLMRGMPPEEIVASLAGSSRKSPPEGQSYRRAAKQRPQ